MKLMQPAFACLATLCLPAGPVAAGPATRVESDQIPAGLSGTPTGTGQQAVAAAAEILQRLHGRRGGGGFDLS